MPLGLGTMTGMFGYCGPRSAPGCGRNGVNCRGMDMTSVISGSVPTSSLLYDDIIDENVGAPWTGVTPCLTLPEVLPG